MKSFWMMGGLAMVLSAGNVGCYLDKLQAEQRANRVLQEDLARSKADLQDAEAMNKQKDTSIDGLRKQLASKEEQANSQSAENQSLREALKKAQDILEGMAGKGAGEVHIVRGPALPQPLHQALQDLAAAHPDLMEYDAARGAVRWKADLLFPLGSDSLASSGEVMEALKKFAEIVSSEKANGFDVVVVGHTCNTRIAKAETRAEHKTNWHLSAHRAIAIMNLLSEQQVAMTRMGVMGYGEYRPIADNTSAEGKAKNRRVEIFLVPKDSVQAVGMGGVYKAEDRGLAAFVKPAALPKPAKDGR